MITPTTATIVAIGALIIFGPKKLPELARSLGKSLAEFRAGAEEAKDTLKRELDAANEPPQAPPPSATEPKPDSPQS